MIAERAGEERSWLYHVVTPCCHLKGPGVMGRGLRSKRGQKVSVFRYYSAALTKRIIKQLSLVLQRTRCPYQRVGKACQQEQETKSFLLYPYTGSRENKKQNVLQSSLKEKW